MKATPIDSWLDDDFSSASSYDDRDIYWDEVEQAWIHAETEMRYNPELRQFYLYVGEGGESRAYITRFWGMGFLCLLLDLKVTIIYYFHFWMYLRT